ncbi:MAG: PEGA domain-containing protein [Bradymonadia bacterium]
MLQILALLVGILGAPAPKGGQITIDVKPGDAKVTLDGRVVKGFKSGRPFNASAGRHTLQITRKGYKGDKRSVTVAKGKTLRINVGLKKVGNFSVAPVKVRPKAKPKGPIVVNKGPKKGKGGAAKKPAVKGGFVMKPGGGKVKPGKPTVKTPVRGPTAKKPTKKPVVAKKPAVTKKPKVTSKPKVAARPKARPKPKVTTRPKTRPRNNRPVAVRPNNNQPNGVRGAAPYRRPSLKPWAALSFVVGAASIAGGVVVGLQAEDKAEEFNDSVFLDDKRELKQDAENLALGSNVLYGVGAAALLIGGLLWAMDDSGSTYGSVTPMPGGGAYVGFGGSF